ncbi:[protein-PII] uridylyltransferase [Lichenihabitans sp. Uapishka_5]|uniref:[protein-PII] uridylyltransferase n=1 Tax=Lichenihabitans sp. Uapishka_5 TaxID=3037302 RepID=UPI0029E80A75|nr:[protein-PII] uridylyltransferase [Lichenihabitans sp. Uapishka_5]MDX7952585.1 [protein-PII] uridylyltransferase [Lichenihabitans sp. Uapishka_5]
MLDTISPDLSTASPPPRGGARFDAAALAASLEAMHRQGLDSAATRAAAVDRFRAVLAEGRAAITVSFLANKRGLACAEALAQLTDAVVSAVHGYVLRHLVPAGTLAAAERLAVVAVGGYGRGTLAPGSDVDLLFLLPVKQAASGEGVVEAMLYILWDLKLKVGHATRSVDECLKQGKADMTIRTALLEARPICGNPAMFDELRGRFEKELVAKTAREFVTAKLAERETRIAKAGASRYIVEPNVKEGKGGLRDLNTLFWISKYVYRVRNPAELVGAGLFTEAEFGAFHRCEEFLWRVRCQLHIAAGRAEERLSFDYQRVIAERLGYRARGGLSAVERFMKHYFLIAKTVGDLTAIVCAALEEKEAKPPAVFDRLVGNFLRRPKSIAGTRDFAIELDRVTVARRDAFERDPLNLIRLYWVADHYGLAIHPDAARLVTLSLKLIDAKLRADPEANRLFMEVLTSRHAPERTLRQMNEAGVLGRFIPEFGRVVALMQFNMYHHYTVDEHLLRSVGILSDIDAGRQADQYPLATTEAMPKIANRAVLYLATFLHDVAKGREEDHSKAGATVARRIAKRFGFGEAERDLVGWLVENHLLASTVAQTRDLADPRTIDMFAAKVGSVERLRCLHILTLCDITAVGPGVWNGWKGELMRTLYRGAEGALSGHQSSLDLKKRVRAAQDELRPHLAGWPAAERDAYMGRHYPTYWLRVDVERKVRHAELLRTVPAGPAPLVWQMRTDPFRDTTELTVVASDHPRFMSVIAGCCAVAGANIVDAQIFTTTDGLALDSITISRAFEQDGDEERRAERIIKSIGRALAGELRLASAVAAKETTPKGRDATFQLETRILIDNAASNRHTLIQVRGMDRPGLLHALTHELASLSLNIVSAHVVTYGEKAVDTFYVTDLTHAKITDAGRQEVIRGRLAGVFAGLEPNAPQPVKAA